ncbi:HET-domain-containing protein, partial [Teratosphaeria nubilosa]
QIRVLRIEPGVAESPLHCRLEVINLLPDEEEAPDSAARRSYEAISYCWGSGEIRETIFLNDQAGFKLSMHLLNALYRLRRPLDTRYVWIDAICINQSDDAERSSQVDQMYQIFGQARHVIIWLG